MGHPESIAAAEVSNITGEGLMPLEKLFPTEGNKADTRKRMRKNKPPLWVLVIDDSLEKGQHDQFTADVIALTGLAIMSTFQAGFLIENTVECTIVSGLRHINDTGRYLFVLLETEFVTEENKDSK